MRAGVSVADGGTLRAVPVRDEMRNAAGAPCTAASSPRWSTPAVAGALAPTALPRRRRRSGHARHQRQLRRRRPRDTIFAKQDPPPRETSPSAETRVTDSAGTLVARSRATYMIIAPRT